MFMTSVLNNNFLITNERHFKLTAMAGILRVEKII